MPFRQVKVTTVALLMVLFFQPSSGSARSLFTSITEAADAATAWFTRMLNTVADLASNEDRRRVILALTDLNKSLYDLEQNKRFLLTTLRREHISRARLERAIRDLQPSVDAVSKSIAAVAPLLRQQYRAGGVEVEEALRRSVGDQKDWVYNYDIIISTEGIDGITAKVNASVEALERAGVALARLIDALEAKSS